MFLIARPPRISLKRPWLSSSLAVVLFLASHRSIHLFCILYKDVVTFPSKPLFTIAGETLLYNSQSEVVNNALRLVFSPWFKV